MLYGSNLKAYIVSLLIFNYYRFHLKRIDPARAFNSDLLPDDTTFSLT